jgi:hypothetical protein
MLTPASSQHPEPARATAILQLEFLAGIARGLTRTADPLAFDEDDAEGGGVEAEAVRVAREDPRTGALRDALFNAVAQVAELWSADAEVGQALSELFKAITALPADVTLLSLPAGPLLGVVCRAAGRRLNGVWLALAAILIAQLNPPPPILSSLKTGPSEEAEACVRQAVGALVTAALGVLGAPGGMVEVCLIPVFRWRFVDLTKMATEPGYCAGVLRVHGPRGAGLYGGVLYAAGRGIRRVDTVRDQCAGAAGEVLARGGVYVLGVFSPSLSLP